MNIDAKCAISSGFCRLNGLTLLTSLYVTSPTRSASPDAALLIVARATWAVKSL